MPPSRTRLALSASVLLALVLVAGLLLGDRHRADTVLESPDAVLEHAAFLGRTGRQEDAARLLRRAIEIHPHRAELYSRLGYVLRYTGMLEESIAAYRYGLELDGRPASRMSAEGQIAKALVYLGDYPAALVLQEGLHHHLEALGQTADEKMLFYEGIMNLYAGNHARAITLFDAALEVEPASLWTAFGQAYRHAATGDTVRLVALARALVARDVADGERHYRLVHFHALAGESAEAIARLRAAEAAGFFAYPYIRDDPLTESLRDVPGFEEALARVRARHQRFRDGW